MKKKLLAVLVSAALVLSAVLIAVYAKNRPDKENDGFNQPQESAVSVENGKATNISPDEAIDEALRHAGVPRENAVMYGVPSLDNENGNAHYDIEFGYGGFEYDYEVAVADGSVLKAEKEAEKVDAPEKESVSAKPEVPESKDSNNGYISVEAAKQKALDDAGVEAKDAVFVKAYYDADDIVPHYDVKFEANGYEYEYEIKASDGSILEKDVDRERKTVNSSEAASEYISADKAKAIAYEHAGVKAADAKLAKAELDRDDLIVHYDVEFVVGKFEYEYEVNAESGKVIAFDKELND